MRATQRAIATNKVGLLVIGGRTPGDSVTSGDGSDS